MDNIAWNAPKQSYKKDMSGAVAIFTNLTKAITPFIEKITGAREELIAFNSILSKTSNLSEDAQKAIDKAKGKKKGKNRMNPLPF